MKRASICLQNDGCHTHLQWFAAVIMTVSLLVVTSCSFAEEYAFPIAPATLNESDLSMLDAIATAENAMIDRKDALPNDFNDYRIKAGFVELETGDSAWIVLLDNVNGGVDAVTTIISPDATVLHYHAGDPDVTMYLLDVWKAKKGEMKTWKLKDKKLFDWLFGNDEQYLMPTDDQIDEITAKNIALQSVTETLSSPTCTCAFELLSFTDERKNQLVWSVTIYENGKEMYVVKLSADTGEVVEVFQVSKKG